MKTFFFILSVFSASAWATPVMIQKNVHLRSVKNGRAVLGHNSKGYYVLKAGSVIDLPDAFTVRDSRGRTNVAESVKKWMSQDSSVGTYKIQSSDNKVVGSDHFFKVRVLRAAPGSNLPSDDFYVALEFLSRTQALKAVEDENEIPTPSPRPEDGGGAAQTGKPQTPPESKLPELNNTYPYQTPDNSDLPPESAQQKLTPASPAPSPTPVSTGGGKDDVLQPVTEDSKVPKVYETPKTGGPVDVVGSSTSLEKNDTPEVSLPDKAPTPTARPDQSETVSGGTTPAPKNENCENCEVTTAGNDSDSKMFCEQVGKGKFPEQLNQLKNGSSDVKDLKAALKSASLLTRNPKNCIGACKYETSGIVGFFDQRATRLKSFCDRTANCAADCNTSKLVPRTSCTKAIREATKNCAAKCSAYLGMDMTKRKLHLHAILDDVTTDIKAKNPAYAERMRKAGILDNMDQRLLCLNLRRENTNLEPFARPCTSTAIGMGQVLVGTFYSTLGIGNRAQQKRCANIALKDLATQCRGFDTKAFRKEIYWKYMDFTPKELYDMRTLDVELQARSSYATFMEKLRFSGFNLNRAYRGYFGKSDRAAINKIENCVKTGR